MKSPSDSPLPAGCEISEEQDLSESGVRLARYTVRPGEPIRGGAVIVHGLGDHSQRHRELWVELAHRGLAVSAVDLPGHGWSGGRRGHIDSMEEVAAVIDSARRRLTELTGDRPIGIGAHSMGCLLVLDYFRAGGSADFSWLWLGSALIDPSHGQPRWKQALGQRLSVIAPRLTIGTGLRRRDIYKRMPGKTSPLLTRAHRRVSLAWGVELLRAGERLSQAAPRFLGDRSLLMTHGSEDRICPPHYAREFFDSLELADKRFELIEGALHEPYLDSRVLREIGAWIDSRL